MKLQDMKKQHTITQHNYDSFTWAYECIGGKLPALICL
uniref:Uncharacterized protein n=1 Tax=Siphoviridae sp. ctEJG5 TaxID=2827814 RepID=A0A8S5RXH2_9CAUD|nr:MAG TPA: hypothetical protein [Siphoviridae sp. ctEJG5]